jgi:hypothetical protein
MKTTPGILSKAALIALAAITSSHPARAQLTVVAQGYAVDPYYTHTTTDSIISFDWDANAELYYMTSAGFPDVAVWKTNGGAPVSIYANPNNFAGGDVVDIGNFIYFNDSDFSNNQFIHDYGPLDPLSGPPSVSTLSTTPNSGLFSHGGNLFISGADTNGTNHLFYSHLAANGSLVDDPAISLGTTPGASGPMAFDAGGNLYYAPGFGNSSIYKWSASELANAMANPTLDPLSTTGHLWLDYSALFPTVSGATSMLLDPAGNLLVTLTDFSNPSDLADFGTNPDGSYDGFAMTILTDGGRLGELRDLNGNTYLAADNEIVQIVPEPGSLLLAGVGLSILLLKRMRTPTGRHVRPVSLAFTERDSA